jgi:Skp family chaperone for outer membrane proteins
MRKFGVCLALTGATVWLTGCGMQFGGSSSSSASRGGIAVVDLDKVAVETGKRMEMDEAYGLVANSVKQKLVATQNDFQAQVNAKAKELGIDPTAKLNPEDIPEEAKREVGQMTLNARNILAQAQNEFGNKLNEYKQVQIAKFRVELKPILQEVASKRGLSVVVPKNDGLLLAIDPGVDITDEVIKAYREKKPAPAAVAAPTPSSAPSTAAPASAPTSAPAQASAKPAAPARTAAKDTASDSKR